MKRVQVGLESREKAQIALDRLFGITQRWKRVEEGLMVRWQEAGPIDRSVPSFGGIREAYVHFTGDRDITGIHVSEDWLPSAFTNALGNSQTKLLLQGYAEQDYGLDLLLPQSNRKLVRDFKTQERVRVGYFDDLPQLDPTVNDYDELSQPTDEKATYTVVTFGGIITIHRQTIVNDDLGFIQQQVSRVGRSARRTLAQRVFDLMVNNGAIYDGITWFHATSHGANLRTTALGAAELDAIRGVMRNQSEKDSGKRLGIGPAILVVPHELEGTAKIENERQYTDSSFTPNKVRYMFGQNSERIIVSPLLTDATDFYVFADQTQVPCIEVGFLQGKQEPELILADGPTDERMFTSDRIRYKVRHEYEATVIDYRGAARNTVAG